MPTKGVVVVGIIVVVVGTQNRSEKQNNISIALCHSIVDLAEVRVYQVKSGSLSHYLKNPFTQTITGLIRLAAVKSHPYFSIA